MNQQTMLVELILGGFFAVACMRTSIPVAPDGRLHFSDFAATSRTHRTAAALAMAVVFDGGVCPGDPAAEGNAVGA